MPESDDSLNYKSPFTIYEDQNGVLLYPFEKNDDSHRSKFIVDLYDHNVALLFTKKNKNMIIYCHIIATKRKGREMGLYIVYKDELSEKIFENFKKKGETILKEMEFNFLDVDDFSNNIFGNNIIFKNISDFDLRENNSFFYDLEMRLLKQEISNGERLNYSGGNKSKITSFVGDFLKSIPEFSLCISSMYSEICSINIQTDFQNNDLNPTGNTKLIIAKIENQIKERKEKERKEKEKKEKEDKINKFINAVITLESRGCNNSSILKHLYLYNSISFSLDSPIDHFIYTLVMSECTLDERKELSEDKKTDLTKEIIRLFKNPYFSNMLNNRIITNEFISCLSQIKESTNLQDLRSDESVMEFTKAVNYELNELDNAIKQIQSYKVNSSEIIKYVYQNSKSRSPIDQFIRIAVESDIAINQKKKSTAVNKSKLTNSFLELFKYLNSKRMLDWKLLQEDEYIRDFAKKANPQNGQRKPKYDQSETENEQTSSSKKELLKEYFKSQIKKIPNPFKTDDAYIETLPGNNEPTESGDIDNRKKEEEKKNKGQTKNQSEDVDSSSSERKKEIDKPEKIKDQNQKSESYDEIFRFGSGNRFKEKESKIKIGNLFYIILLVLLLILVILIILHLLGFSFQEFGNFTPILNRLQ